jgi:hypothetical protein
VTLLSYAHAGLGAHNGTVSGRALFPGLPRPVQRVVVLGEHIDQLDRDAAPASDARMSVRCRMAPRNIRPGKPFDDEIAEANRLAFRHGHRVGGTSATAVR